MDFNNTQVIVFDEGTTPIDYNIANLFIGDKLLDLGFQDQIDEIIKYANEEDERRRTAGNRSIMVCFCKYS